MNELKILDFLNEDFQLSLLEDNSLVLSSNKSDSSKSDKIEYTISDGEDEGDNSQLSESKISKWVNKVKEIFTIIINTLSKWLDKVLDAFSTNKMAVTKMIIEKIAIITRLGGNVNQAVVKLPLEKDKKYIQSLQLIKTFGKTKGVIDSIKYYIPIGDLINKNLSDSQKEDFIDNMKDMRGLKSNVYLRILKALGDTSAKPSNSNIYDENNPSEIVTSKEFSDRFIENCIDNTDFTGKGMTHQDDKVIMVALNHIGGLYQNNGCFDIANVQIKALVRDTKAELNKNIRVIESIKKKKDITKLDLNVYERFIQGNKTVIECVSTLPTVFKESLKICINTYMKALDKYKSNIIGFKEYTIDTPKIDTNLSGINLI